MSDDLSANDVASGRVSAPRLALAFVVAPLVPALIISTSTLFDGTDNGSFLDTVALFVVFGGYPAALVFGLPTLLIMKRWLRPRLIWVVLAGGFVAAAPWALATLFVSQPDSASIGSNVTVANGQRTLWGWIEAAKFLGMVFALGAVGGLAFWLVGIFRFSTGRHTTERPTP